MRAVLKNMSKKDKKEVAYMLKDAIGRGQIRKSRLFLIEWDIKKAADTVDRFQFDLWNYKGFPPGTLEKDPDHQRIGESQQRTETKKSRI